MSWGLAAFPVAVVVAPALVAVTLVVPGVIVVAVGFAITLVLLGVLPGMPGARAITVAVLVAECDAAVADAHGHVGGLRGHARHPHEQRAADDGGAEQGFDAPGHPASSSASCTNSPGQRGAQPHRSHELLFSRGARRPRG